MGCSDDECWDDELPQHQVTLSDFKIAKYPVTQQQWVTIMGTNIWGQLYDDNFPAEHVVIWEDKSFLNAQDFIDKLNVITGKNYRLPTEAEWEYAARGGSKSKGYKYSGCDDINDVAWYIDNNEKKPHPVGTKKPNELGIYDMSGSVFEWCSDLFGDYTAEPQINPQGTASGLCHVLRGGAYDTKKQLCRVSTRFYYCPNERYFIMGFRLVLP